MELFSKSNRRGLVYLLPLLAIVALLAALAEPREKDVTVESATEEKPTADSLKKRVRPSVTATDAAFAVLSNAKIIISVSILPHTAALSVGKMCIYFDISCSVVFGISRYRNEYCVNREHIRDVFRPLGNLYSVL